MADRRLNPVIARLEAGETVFGGGFVPNGSRDHARAFAAMDYDFVVVETEHEGFEARGLRDTLQYLLHTGSRFGEDTAPPAPFVRLPPNGREQNQWVLKQALDMGTFGLCLPHIETVEEAQAAVRASRYPQARGVEDAEPEGERGFWPMIAPAYWGLDPTAYYDRADLWPLDPDGEVILMPIIESPRGVENLDAILAQTPGIGAIWAGPGDYSIGLGVRGDIFHPDVEDGMRKVLAVCQAHDVPCCAIAMSTEEAERRIAEGYQIIFSMPGFVDPVLELRK